GGRAHYLRARGGGDGARARHPRRGGGGLPARRFVRQAPQADGRLGRVLRQGRNGRGEGARARSCANTAIASPKARGRGRGPPPDTTAVRLAPRHHITSGGGRRWSWHASDARPITLAHWRNRSTSRTTTSSPAHWGSPSGNWTSPR